MHSESEALTQTVRLPRIWRRPDVLVASLGINILALALPVVILQAYDRVIPQAAMGTFHALMLGMIGVVVLDTALRVFRSTILSWKGARFDHRESLNAIDQILKMDSMAYSRNSSGYYLERIQALEKVQEFYSGQSLLLMMDLPFVVIFLALIWSIAGPLVLVPVALLATFVLISAITGRHLHEALVTRSTMEERRQNYLIEVLQGIHTVKSMAMESFMLRRYERLQLQSAESVSELARINSIVQGIGSTFSQASVIIFVAIGSFSVVAGELTVGGLAAGTMLSGRVLQPGLRAMAVWTQFQSVRLAYQKVNDLFAQPREQDGEQTTDTNGLATLEMKGVSFAYPGQDRPLIDNVSLSLGPGEVIGITGANGVGKSTLLRLMSGFLTPDSGELTLGSRRIHEYSLATLRSQIGIVPQNGVLFEGTILENMTLYREGEAVEEALELAAWLGLDKIIARLPDGLDTRVGGSNADALAEGVKQKIIMVRALVGHPQLILFDDANASFDIKNDTYLLQMLQKFRGKRSMVIVSHRPSFLRMANRVMVLDNGRLHEPGADDSHRRPGVPERTA